MAAVRAWNGSGDGLIPADATPRSWLTILLTCLAFTFLNPHVYLDTTVLFGSLAARYTEHGRWLFALGACCASALWFSSLGFGARLFVPLFRNSVAWRVLDVIVAVVMLSLATALLLKPLAHETTAQVALYHTRPEEILMSNRWMSAFGRKRTCALPSINIPNPLPHRRPLAARSGRSTWECWIQDCRYGH